MQHEPPKRSGKNLRGSHERGLIVDPLEPAAKLRPVSLTALLWALVLTGSPPARVHPAVGVGQTPPPPDVLSKLTELANDVVDRTGAATAPPPAPVSPTHAWVEEARNQYFALDFKGSARFAEQALTYFDAHPEAFEDGWDYVMAHVYAALAAVELRDEQGALTHLRSALVVKPSLRLSEAEFSPTARTLLERAAADVAAGGQGALGITSSPGLAAVTVDGQPKGQTPVRVRGLGPGRHHVQAQKPGHLPVHRWVTVGAGEATVQLALPQSQAEERGQALDAAIRAGRMDIPALARGLLETSRAPRLIVFAVERAGPRYAVVGASISPQGVPARAYATVSAELVDAVEVMRGLMSALERPDASRAPVPVPGAPAPPSLRFDLHFLGLGPAPVLALTEPPPPLYKRPWVWVSAAGAVALIAGGSIYLATRPPPPPSGVALTLQLPAQ